MHCGIRERGLCKSRLCICYCFVSFMLPALSNLLLALSLSNLLSGAFIGRLGGTERGV